MFVLLVHLFSLDQNSVQYSATLQPCESNRRNHLLEAFHHRLHHSVRTKHLFPSRCSPQTSCKHRDGDRKEEHAIKTYFRLRSMYLDKKYRFKLVNISMCFFYQPDNRLYKFSLFKRSRIKIHFSFISCQILPKFLTVC